MLQVSRRRPKVQAKSSEKVSRNQNSIGLSRGYGRPRTNSPFPNMREKHLEARSFNNGTTAAEIKPLDVNNYNQVESSFNESLENNILIPNSL